MNWKYFDSKFEYEEMFDDACWPWTGHRYFAYDLIRNLKPEVVVELGTHKGTSFYAFSQGAKDENLSTKLFAVDTWEGDEHAGFYGDDIYNEVQDIIKKYYGQQQVQLLRKTFDAALSDFSDHSIDILHIDGLHTYEAVKHDFDSWLAKVKINGIILFHDIYISRGDFGVYKFWDELKAKYKTIEFHQSYGLGVLFLEEEKYDWIIKNGEDIARYYSFMAEDKKNERIMKKFNEISEMLKTKEAEIAAMVKEIAQLNKTVQVKDRMIQEKVAELDSIKSSLRWKVPNKLHKMIRG